MLVATLAARAGMTSCVSVSPSQEAAFHGDTRLAARQPPMASSPEAV